jgi:Cu/Ag efflux protein CusF
VAQLTLNHPPHFMKTILSFTLAAAFLFASPVMALAAKTGKTGKREGFKGKVTAVDATAHTITLTNKKSGETKTFKVGKRVKISVDKVKGKQLADISVGMKAKVKEGGKGQAEMIRAKSHKGKKKNT